VEAPGSVRWWGPMQPGSWSRGRKAHSRMASVPYAPFCGGGPQLVPPGPWPLQPMPKSGPVFCSAFVGHKRVYTDCVGSNTLGGRCAGKTPFHWLNYDSRENLFQDRCSDIPHAIKTSATVECHRLTPESIFTLQSVLVANIRFRQRRWSFNNVPSLAIVNS
jgi:hypothetical protein